MPKIRVLVVDDSVLSRRMISDALAPDPGIEVVGTAADGKIALAKIAHLAPDLVILDVEMPEMDGLQTLKAIRKDYPKLPVIMFSALTARDSAESLDALALGANDYATKPAATGGLAAAMEQIRGELAPKIKSLCRRIPEITSCPVPRKPATGGSGSGPMDILAIGVSTGGPNALEALLHGLMANFPVPVVIVQHMPPFFTRLLAERLSASSGFRGREGEAGALLQPGDLWIAPGGSHMAVEKAADGVRLRIHDEPPENSCRPAVDVLFRSIAKVYGARSLSVVLTGMGQDGLVGCQFIREAGGTILVQDEATSIVWGMPGAVFQAGLADKMLPLNELADEINQRFETSRSRPGFAMTPKPLGALVKAL